MAMYMDLINRSQVHDAMLGSGARIQTAIPALAIMLGLVWVLSGIQKGATKIYSYQGTDFPREWPIGPLETVFLTLENSARYALGADVGSADWNKTLPSGGGLLHLGEQSGIFSISMFHQLRCINIIRQELDLFLAGNRTSPRSKHLTHHCMNYLRQTVLCRAELRLESARSIKGPRIAVSDITHRCKDWSAVYAAAEENNNAYVDDKGEA